MSRGLAKLGHRVTLFAPVPSPFVEEGVTVLPTNLRSKRERLFGVPRLIEAIRDQEPDIVHFHDPELLPWFASRACRLRPAKVIYDVHEYYPESAGDSNYFGWAPASRAAGWLFGKLQPRWAKRLDAAIGVTPPISEDVGRLGARVCTVRNMPDIETIPVGPASGEAGASSTIVMGGVMDAFRLMPELLSAIAMLGREWPDLNFVGFGDLQADPYGRELQVLARRLGISERVEFRPRVPWVELQGHLQRSVLGPVLLANRQTYRWSLPTRLFEYMALGVPVVCTGFPLVRDVVESSRCGIIIEDAKPESIAEAMGRLLVNRGMASTMGQMGQLAVATHHHWSLELQKLVDLYASLIGDVK